MFLRMWTKLVHAISRDSRKASQPELYWSGSAEGGSQFIAYYEEHSHHGAASDPHSI